MRLLIAGGAGFIGATFIRYWRARRSNDEIVCVDLLTYAGDSSAPLDAVRDGYRFVRADVADAPAIEALMRETAPDIVVNFAAESHNSRAVLNPSVFTHTNVLGTQVLLEATRRARVRRYHQVSTCEVYGDLDPESDGAFTEAAPYAPRSPYSASKAGADLVARAYHLTYGMEVTISTAANTYGPRQHPEKVIPLFITHALDGQPLPVYEHSAYRREWLHVEDHCEALEIILLRGRAGETYNIGSGEERTIDELADAILSTVPDTVSVKTYVPDRPAHDRRYRLDSSKMLGEFGWRATRDFSEGLARTIEWYASNRSWWEPRRALALDESGWPRSRS
jgi:dTDP-glucose 4,6-dehydratase